MTIIRKIEEDRAREIAAGNIPPDKVPDGGEDGGVSGYNSGGYWDEETEGGDYSESAFLFDHGLMHSIFQMIISYPLGLYAHNH